MEKRFDEGFDNILIYDHDEPYRKGKRLEADSLMAREGGKRVLLNGSWRFCPDVFLSCVRTRWFEETRYNRNGLPIPFDFDFEHWEEIQVPGVWNSQRGEYALYEGAGLYFRSFSLKQLRREGLLGKAGGRLILKIGAANYETRIWLNRKYLGRHLGGFTPFCADLTDHLEEENRLLISVDNTRRGDQVPSVHYDWFNYGGIFRDVELIETPELYIQDTFVYLSKQTPDQIEYRVRLRNSGSGEPEDGTPVEVEIPELGLSGRTEARDWRRESDGLYEAAGTLPIKEDAIQKWSPEDPVLYRVTVRAGGEAGDCREEEIGFRRIEARGRHLFLNGREIFLKGMCVHEESARSQRCLTRQEIEEMMAEAKELGCNFLRLTHYPHSQWAAETADRMGLLLLEEIPVYWALEFENPDTRRDAENQLEELIRRDRNRASVILWSVGNENPDSDARFQLMEGLVKTARRLDPSRLVIASCLIDVDQRRIRDRLISVLDVVGINEYYGWYLKDFEVLEEILDRYEEEKPLVITETGADAACGYFSRTAELYSEELQAQIYEKQFQTLFRYPFIRGVTPWVLYDYASMRRMNAYQKGYNLKGIMGKDRRYRKLAYYVVKRVYQGSDQKKGEVS